MLREGKKEASKRPELVGMSRSRGRSALSSPGELSEPLNLSSTGSSLIRLPPEAVVLICACFRLLASAIRIPLGSEDARPDILIGSAEKEMLSSAVVTACSKPCQVAVATFQSSSSY